MRLMAATTLASALLLSGTSSAQALRPLHVSNTGVILDDTGKPVVLRGLNRSGTGSGNADATATDQDYAAQNQLLSMNLVRIFVNAAWWMNNVQVPIAGTTYQTYIDQLIQRAKKYGNYALILKAGQFPDAPCGSDGKNCPALNQGDLNCQANPSVCAAQDTTGSNIDTAFAFWSGFSQKYGADPAVLYDTWEDMHAIDINTWSDDQDQLIAAIRTYSPQSVVFVEDTGTAFESIVQGTLADLAWPNVVWDFHLYNGPTGACTEPLSPRIANWPQNFSPLVRFARQQGHGVAIAEWGFCNDSEPYHTNITSFAKDNSIGLVYFDFSNLITKSGSSYQLTATGTKVALAYSAIATSGPGAVASVSSASFASALSAEALAAGFGTNLATVIESAPTLPLPIDLGGTSVQVQDAMGISRDAEMLFVSPGQLNYQIPPGVATGTATVTVLLNGAPVAFGTANIANVAPGVFAANANGQGVAAAVILRVKANGTQTYEPLSTFDPVQKKFVAAPIDLGPATDQVFLVLFGTGIRNRSSLQAVAATIGGVATPAIYAGVQGAFIGLDQINLPLARTLIGRGQVNVVLTVDGMDSNTVTISFK
jgi:uncharacterized protein (TIGR03437 family)